MTGLIGNLYQELLEIASGNDDVKNRRFSDFTNYAKNDHSSLGEEDPISSSSRSTEGRDIGRSPGEKDQSAKGRGP